MEYLFHQNNVLPWRVDDQIIVFCSSQTRLTLNVHREGMEDLRDFADPKHEPSIRCTHCSGSLRLRYRTPQELLQLRT